MTEILETVTQSNTPGTWMLTATGQRFFPLDPDPSTIKLEDIGWALAQTCRYGGHVPPPYYYSVAEHSWILSQWFEVEDMYAYARWAFVHDFSEAYIGDVIRPLKPKMPDFKKIEYDLERKIWTRFGFNGDLPQKVYDADKIICNDERIQLWPYEIAKRDGLFERPRLHVQLKCWERQEAYKMFMERAKELDIR